MGQRRLFLKIYSIWDPCVNNHSIIILKVISWIIINFNLFIGFDVSWFGLAIIMWNGCIIFIHILFLSQSFFNLALHFFFIMSPSNVVYILCILIGTLLNMIVANLWSRGQMFILYFWNEIDKLKHGKMVIGIYWC